MRLVSTALLSVCVCLLVACGDKAPSSSGGSTQPNSTGSNSEAGQSQLLDQSLILNRTQYTGEIGETIEISATAEGTGTLSFTSSDSAIAEVSSNGLLTLKKQGVAVITATIANDELYKSANATITVNVSRKKTSISFDIESIDISVFDTASHLPTLSREGAYYFNSSDTTVAQVDSTGVVTAIGAGTSVITARIPANLEFDTATTSYTVNVTRVNQDITFSPIPNPVTIFSGRTTTVTATALGDTTVQYRSLDESIATVAESGTIIAISEGATSIQAFTEETDQYNAASIELPISVEDVLLSVNPSTNTLLFSWQSVSMFDQYRIYKRVSDLDGFEEVFHSSTEQNFQALVDPISDKQASFFFEACNDSYCYTSDTLAVSEQGIFENIIGILKPDLTQADNKFAQAVDVSDDGTRMIVGSPYENEQRGVVYLYELVGTEWTLVKKIVKAGRSGAEIGDLLGAGVAISGDGETIAYSAPGNDISMDEYVEKDCSRLSCPYPDFPLVDHGSVHVAKWSDYRVDSVYNDYGILGAGVNLNRDGSVMLFEVKDYSGEYIDLYARKLQSCCRDYFVAEAFNSNRDFSADSKRIVIAENLARFSQILIHQNDSSLVYSYEEVFRLRILDVEVTHIGVSKTGERFILTLDTKELLVYDIEITIDENDIENVSYNKTFTTDLNDYEVKNATISDDGTRILIAGTDQTVRILTESDTGWIVQEEIESPNLDLGDCFGCVLAKPNDGDVFVIGAPGEDSGSREDLVDNSVSNNGALYLF